ncbi:MAG: tRNA glutamyl-Q(34) synthetase GluQRS [Clostridia bacterium]|nr:tRNA glutamyl-Q(34) synthetase GluQRS [Clostridia bacterium]
MSLKGRFAPSPSGWMHLGNLYAMLIAWLDARSAGGTMLMRIENLDPERCKKEYALRLMDDLRWFGLDWDEGPYYQGERSAVYEAEFERLRTNHLVYPCFCSRSDRLAAAAPHPGEEKKGAGSCPCRFLSERERAEKSLTRAPAWKIAVPDETVSFEDGLYGAWSENLAEGCGDFILRRADGGYAYQLAVTVDDALMGVTRVVRGRDLLDSTPRQIWLQRELGYAAPSYLHVPLLTAPDGRRLSKREGDLGTDELRRRYRPEELTGILAEMSGIRRISAPISPKELISDFFAYKLRKSDVVLK